MSGRLRKRRFCGSGIESVLKQTMDADSQISPTAKHILTELLESKGIEIPEEEPTHNIDERYGGNLTVSRKDAITPGVADTTVAELGRDGKLSLFRSLLSVIDRSKGLPVPAKHFIRTCCLSLRPGDVPGALDAKEVVLSALFFLSSTLETQSSHLVSLPLLRPLQESGDLEKRSYEKVGNWQIGDIEYKVLHLEQAFLNSPTSFQWLSREKFCPRLSTKEESRFFLKGAIPATLSGKKTRGEGGYKKKKVQTGAGDDTTTESPKPAKTTK